MDVPKAKILVVDDEANVLLTVQAILAYEGYDVDALADPEAALAAIRSRHYDLVLTDLKMPKVDGLAILAQVRKSSPGTVTVMMTGYAAVDSALEALQLGAYEYLVKPTEIVDLKQAVRRSLERKRLSEIDTLYHIGRTVTTALDMTEIADRVSEAARRVLHLEFAQVVPLTENSPPPADGELRALVGDRDVLAWLRDDRVVTTDDALPAAQRWAASAGASAYALVPGCARGRLACVLCTHDNGRAYDFHASAQRFLSALAGQSALALDNAALVSELRHNNHELATANTKLRELDRLKSQFLSAATHELRTPLTVILGYNSMLAESLQDRLNDEEQETMRESVTACKRLIRLVNSMLDISQIESGRMPMNFTRADLRQLVQGAVALFQNEARQHQLELKLELPARMPRIELDAERIQQVLLNLLGNAVKFTPPGGTITVAVRNRAEAQEAEVAVTDTGRGIALEDQARIFDEFGQIRGRRPVGSEGSGLGLAISRRIVAAHEGAIRVKSELDRGSTFSFTLPSRARGHRLESAVSA